MSALEEYRKALEYAAGRDVFLTSVAVESLADDAIAELETNLTWAMGLNACIEHARAEQAAARCKELAEDAADRIGALNASEAERDALRDRRCTSCDDEAECSILTAVCEYGDWEIEDSYQFGCRLHSDDRTPREGGEDR